MAGGNGAKLGLESAGASPWRSCAKAGACASAKAIVHSAAARLQEIAGLKNPIMSPGRRLEQIDRGDNPADEYHRKGRGPHPEAFFNDHARLLAIAIEQKCLDKEARAARND